jgi:hypothetical protein
VGTWGDGTFENDTAVDWILEVKERGDASTVRMALMAVAVADNAGLLDAHIGCEALAACEIVAAALGLAPSAPENPRIAEVVPALAAFAEGATGDVEVVAARMPELVGDVELARRAVDAVLDSERSELHMLWSEENWTSPHWLAVVEDLRRRLDGATRT